MCGRYDSHRSSTELADLLEATDVTDGQDGSYNVAPSSAVRIAVHDADGGRQLRSARWGLVPFWAKEARIGQRMINARAESAADKPAYRAAVRRTRCLVPADGWYEWAVTPAGKRPRYLHPADGGLLTMAGLYSWWERGDAPLLTCTIVTTAAVGPLREVHERMPLLLSAEAWQQWLDPAGDPRELLAAPPPTDLLGGLEIRPVGRAVGNVRSQGPQLLAPVAD